MPFCTACGRQNPDDARFCSQCGTRLVAPEPTIDPNLPVGSALLVVQKGPGAGSRFLLDQDVVNAGRHPDSEIFLDDVTVSRRHAVFNRSGDGYTVSDVGSLNGTYVNRDRIETVALTDSDEVQIGKYRLVYFAGHEDV
jgi:pSer/pThr/pTyr-binding forkhead associated (FHA) protein